MLTSKATQRRRTITERQSVAFCFGRSRKVGKPYAAEGAAEMEKVIIAKTNSQHLKRDMQKFIQRQQRKCDDYGKNRETSEGDRSKTI